MASGKIDKGEPVGRGNPQHDDINQWSDWGQVTCSGSLYMKGRTTLSLAKVLQTNTHSLKTIKNLFFDCFAIVIVLWRIAIV